MNTSVWTNGATTEAKKIWSRYQEQHSLSDLEGQTAGIDPCSGHIWFGESVQDIVAQRDAEGIQSPLFFERVGSETYFRKGHRR